MPEEKAKFQVISLVTGVGFTTKESEIVTRNPDIRRIAQFIMLTGYLGTATSISFLINILRSEVKPLDIVILLILLLVVLWLLSNKHLTLYIDMVFERFIFKQMKKRSSKNIYTMLKQSSDYGLYQIYVKGTHPMVGKKLIDANLKENKIQVLNVDKGDQIILFPEADYIIQQGDTLLVYGKITNIIKYFELKRNSGFKA
ncbi:TrkA C-terminal domain-containing protein [Desulfitobacterium sp. Sab5]|uniref:TrkA C-terminal domain-containing protein n=1 Tax=Desulfitobacterium nosdiversum TaxID=3375356 RepID=UPI003CFB2AA8